MMVIGMATTNLDNYLLYQYGHNNYCIVADNGDWSLRGSRTDIVEELANLGLSFNDFK